MLQYKSLPTELYLLTKGIICTYTRFNANDVVHLQMLHSIGNIVTGVTKPVSLCELSVNHALGNLTHHGGLMVKNDKNVVTLSSADNTIQVVICLDEMDVKALYEKVEAEGTHFINGWNARIFIKTEKGVLVLIPQ